MPGTSESQISRAVAKHRRAGHCAPETDFDLQLLLQYRAGNRDAANMLVRRNFDRVYRYLGRIVRHERTREDLTQDVLLTILARAADFDGNARFTTWLYRIATNRALNHLKHEASRRPLDAPLGDAEAAVPDRRDNRPERRLSAEDVKRRVSRALAELPANQRVALTLFEYEDLPYEQIAAILDVSTDAVRALLLRARRALRTKLDDLL